MHIEACENVASSSVFKKIKKLDCNRKIKIIFKETKRKRTTVFYAGKFFSTQETFIYLIWLDYHTWKLAVRSIRISVKKIIKSTKA